VKYFVTGVAGFIGFHLARRLLAAGHEVRGFDGLTQYYDPTLKRARLAELMVEPNFSWFEGMLESKTDLENSLDGFAPDVMVHLAAQAGVRYSIDSPEVYVDSNLVGTFNILELARSAKPGHFMFSSTSSVYGGNEKLPYSESDPAHQPISLYAATKKAGEVMTHAYSHLFDIPTTCFRFFTVYGPWGRPDMAPFKFVERIERGEPIEVYGEGKMSRDFTYIDDLVTGVEKLSTIVPQQGDPIEVPGITDSLSTVAPWRVVNIAGGQPVGLLDFIESIESHLGKEANKVFLPMQPGDVAQTWANAGLLKALTGFLPDTPVDEGVEALVKWYREYHSAT